MLIEMEKIGDMREAITGFVRNNTFTANHAMGVISRIQTREYNEQKKRLDKER